MVIIYIYNKWWLDFIQYSLKIRNLSFFWKCIKSGHCFEFFNKKPIKLENYYPQTSSQQQNHFLVTTVGNSGSLWLANALNMHPEILCSMGIDHPVISMIYKDNKEEYQNIVKAYESGILPSYGIHDINRFNLMGINIPGNKRNIGRIGEFLFEELCHINSVRGYPKQFLGNVHGLSLGQVHKYYKNFQNVRIMELVRNPIPRRSSYINHFMATYQNKGDLYQKVNHYFQYNSSEVRFYKNKFGITFDNDTDKVAFYVENILKLSISIAREYKLYDVKLIQFEKIRSDKDYFSDVIKYLTNNQVKVTEEYINQVFDQYNLKFGRIYNTANVSKNPLDIFEDLPDWEKYMLSKIFKENNLDKIYSSVGYDLSFVTNYT